VYREEAVAESHVSRTDDYSKELPPRVAAALAAAEIPPSKLGAARRARLEDSERELYFWILDRFATRGRPSSLDTAEAAERLGLNAQDALETLTREDLVHLDGSGEIAVAYPFSGRPTAHEVRFEGGHRAHAMCAIDALGIAPMFSQSIQIASSDPLAGGDVRAHITPEGEGTWEPESAVVVAGVIDRSGASFRGCCPALNFFVSNEASAGLSSIPTSAEKWCRCRTRSRPDERCSATSSARRGRAAVLGQCSMTEHSGAAASARVRASPAEALRTSLHSPRRGVQSGGTSADGRGRHGVCNTARRGYAWPVAARASASVR
jgi:alkylmercury lyase-like protein